MGLTRSSVGLNAADSGAAVKRSAPEDLIIALAGNPNVGKSSVFNALTGLRQHTGNWPGKTVASAQGRFETERGGYILVDLPGAYSLSARSAEEQVARDFIRSGQADAVAVVCDATCLERNLILALQILDSGTPVLVCVNLMDEARRRGVELDLAQLSAWLGCPVVGVSAHEPDSLSALKSALDALREHRIPREPAPEADARDYVRRAEALAAAAVRARGAVRERDLKVDRVLTSRWGGYPAMLALLALVFWLTLEGANYLSGLLSGVLFELQDTLMRAASGLSLPGWLRYPLILGAYRTLAWVVSVMLPPMAIFFPLFTLLEDSGFLPRVAYNLDSAFKRCRACGKQALTMCMGLGCNAAGVAGCRIIDSDRERLIAVITNSLVPCNGRFPTLIAVIAMFFAGTVGSSALSALLLTGLILLGVGMTFACSRLLSATVLRGAPSSFTLELPPYRRPQIGQVVVRSLLDRTLFVLGRAAAVAAPAGLVLWLMANLFVGGQSLLMLCAGFLDPFARLLGLDGVILLAFILGFPANEIVVPIIIMAYTAQGALLDMPELGSLRELLQANGWTWRTAASMLIFTMFHWPCSTTLITIKKETGSAKWAALSLALPTAVGMVLCFVFTQVTALF